EAPLQDEDGLNLPLPCDGESALPESLAAGSTDRQSGAPDRERTGMPAETTLSMEQRTMVQLLRISASSLFGAVDNFLDYSLLETGQIELACDSFDLEQLMGDLFRALDVPARQRGLRLC